MLTLLDLPTDGVATAVATGAVVCLAYALQQSLSGKDKKQLGNEARVHVVEGGYPIIGHLLVRVANQYRMYDWATEKAIQYHGEPWKFKIPGQAEVVVFTMPEAIEEITMKQLDNFPKGEMLQDLVFDFFGAGLVASDGMRWYHQRKAAVKFFTAKNLRTLMKHTMQQNIRKVCESIDSRGSEMFNIQQLFMEFTIETFVRVGMGVDLDCIGAAKQHPFAEALDIAGPATSRRFSLPAWVWKTERWLNIGPEAALKRHMAIVDKWIREAIQQSLASANRKKVNRNSDTVTTEEQDDATLKNVIELFVEHGGEGVEGMQADDLVDFLQTFVIAARDTTADTLCWLFYALSKNPQVEKNIRAEMKAKFGSEHISYLTTEHIKSLTYLEATIKETIRLYPGAPFTLREALNDTVICGDIPIRKGQIIGMCAYAMARTPEVWGPDAAEFKPERWIDPATGEIIQVSSTKMFSFSAGPRTCVGMNLAMLELRIVTANLLYRYEFEIDPSNDGSYVIAPTFNMKHPLFAKASRIK